MLPDSVLDLARKRTAEKLSYTFSPLEERVLRSFFTNLTRRVFFMHSLPANVGAALMAMFSRIKNPRGLRGVFVDTFLPQFLASQLVEVESDFNGDPAAFLRKQKINSLQEFVNHSPAATEAYEEFVSKLAVDPEYFTLFADSRKARKFLEMWLDRYGHNSIARMGSVWLCCEKVSVLAAKSLEWTRPGSGYIELSTRYVDMSASGCYPVEAELAEGWGIEAESIERARDEAFESYRGLSGHDFDGPLPQFLRDRYGTQFQGKEKDLESGVVGETCDVLGNLLPASSLTSVGICISGEAFPQLLKHLLLDDTPENIALAEAIEEEAKAVGAEQFARHVKPSEWEESQWQYLSASRFSRFAGRDYSSVEPLLYYDREQVELTLRFMFRDNGDGDRMADFDSFIRKLPWNKRGDFDKLPAEFEAFTVVFDGVMSFRGWRDLQRMGFCTHFRTLLSPALGFYQYNKPAPTEVHDALDRIEKRNKELAAMLAEKGVPPQILQYPLSLGNRVGFSVGANLRQWEFCTWQRSKFSVNHEVREVFLGIERYLRDLLSWWGYVSRADATPAYLFARGSEGFPLEETVGQKTQ